MMEVEINGIKQKTIRQKARELAKKSIEQLEHKLGIENAGNKRTIVENAS